MSGADLPIANASHGSVEGDEPDSPGNKGSGHTRLRPRPKTSGSSRKNVWAVRTIAIAFVVAGLGFTLADHAIPSAPDLSANAIQHYHGDTILGARARWDSKLFRSIADDGYHYPANLEQNPAIFPGYPLMMRYLGYLVGDSALAGVLIGGAAGAIGIFCFYRWCATRMSLTAARVSLLTLLVYPYALYLFGVAYADALLFLGAVAAFSLLDKGHTIAAAGIAAFVSATRLQGIALNLGLILRVLELRGVVEMSGRRVGARASIRERVGRLRPLDFTLLFGFVGLAAYCLFLSRTFNSPLLFMEASKQWGNGSSIGTLLKTGMPEMIINGTNSLRFGMALQMVLFTAAAALVPSVVRRFGWAYGAYVVLILGSVMIGRADFYGSGRYVLAAFPAFGAAGLFFADRPHWRRRLWPPSIALSAGIITMWVAGQWVS